MIANSLAIMFLTAIVFILLYVLMVKPKHLGVKFSNGNPPIIAWVNAPSIDATEQQRTVVFPNNDYCVIPEGMRGHFVTVFDWQVPLEIDGVQYILTLPKHTRTDFASIPRFMHSLLSPLNNTVYAAIVHDYLYRNPADPVAAAIKRDTADRIFYWGMRARGVWKITAGVMYLGVRVGGIWSYKRNLRV